MIELPVSRKFGGPEIALIAVAFAFAISMTAWWHGLYQAPTDAVPLYNQVQRASVAGAERARQITVVAYLVNGTPSEALPSLADATSTVLTVPPDRGDSDQTFLHVVAVLGAIAAGVYCLAVYPAIRRFK